MQRSSASIAFALAFLATLPGLVHGQTATLVRDIDPGPPDPLAHESADPSFLGTLGDRVLFVAQTPSLGFEPFASDGTAAGTTLLADVCPGDCGAALKPLGTAGGLFFFAASLPGDSAAELWRTDGTRAGTFVLSGVTPVLPTHQPPSVATLGRFLYFAACTAPGTNPCGVWQSDGNEEGTRLVAAESGVGPLAVFHGKLFFLAGGRTQQRALWTSDGTAAGTVETAALPARVLGFYSLAATADRLFLLVASTSIPQPIELWTSDGTEAGTRQLAGFKIYPNPGFPVVKATSHRLYLAADDGVHGAEIWASDGTPAGTLRITDLAPANPFGDDFGLNLLPSQLEVLGDRLLFVASDGQSTRLFSSDGTPESTAQVGNVSPSVDSPLVRVGNRVVFAGLRSPDLSGAWSTDGTTAGTAPLCHGHCSEILLPPQPLLGAAFFIARDFTTPFATSVWMSDGTPAGTRRYTDVDIGNPHPAIRQLATAGGRVFFPGYDDHGQELWVSDGRPGGTHLVADLSADGANTNPESLTGLGDRLFFTACDGRSGEVWTSAGTAASTLPLTALGAPCYSGRPTALTAAGAALFFVARSGSGLALWATDGGGSLRLLLGADPGLASLVVPYQGQALFLRLAGADGQVWTSDGTAAGTRARLTLPGLRRFQDLAVASDSFYVTGATDASPCQLWKGDLSGVSPVQVLTLFCDLPLRLVPTGAGTLALSPEGLWAIDGAGSPRRIADFNPDQEEEDPPSGLVELQGKAYFFAEDPAVGHALWGSDGTPGGTRPIRAFHLPPDPIFPPQPAQITVLGGRLYFVERDDEHGSELWTSDGTPEGTALVADIAPGPASAQIEDLTVAAGRLFFAADDGVHGSELWTSDGTAAGTRLVEDLAPGPASSAPREIHAVGSRLYWSADDGLAGRELWALDLGGPGGCQVSDTRLCLSASRFQVEIAWTDFQGHTGVGHAVPLTADTGYFWFFDPANVEAVVKTLDGRALDGHFWVFYGALSNVEYTLTVTDTQSGATRRYFNPRGQLASVGDTQAFGPLGAFDTKSLATAVARPSPLPLVSTRTDARSAAATCAAGPGMLCLQGGRFAVTAVWKDFQGRTGTGTAVPLSGDTGYFWFFAPTNVEVVTKVLDGTGLNGKFWFFYGALSNVEYTLTVTDTRTGAVKTYKNPSGQFGSLADTGAF